MTRVSKEWLARQVKLGQRIKHRKNVLRYFLDTEFYDNGTTIDLISIGIACSDGREFYAVSKEARLDLVSPWLRFNVLPHLPPYASALWLPREKIRDLITDFVWNYGHSADGSDEFWAYYAAYDWVALCQLYGGMMELPQHMPKCCMDLKQFALMVGNPELPKQPLGEEHHALHDARHDRDLYEFLRAHGEK